MNIIEVSEGLEQGKKYNLPGWDRFYIFAKDNCIYIKSIYVDKQIYNLHINELQSNNWMEVK